MYDSRRSKLEGTATAGNLAKAFAGETQAHMKYMLFAENALAENLHNVAYFFNEAASNEKGHAEAFLDYMSDGLNINSIEVQTDVTTKIGTTMQNLQAAAFGETAEANKIYQRFASIAAKEGFPEISDSFAKIATIEKRHATQFQNLFMKIRNGTLYKSSAGVEFRCLNCGLIVFGKNAPEICPACRHEQNYFFTNS